MNFRTLEFELPLFSLIFLLILLLSYYSKGRLNIIENKYYNKILLFSLIEVFLDTILHIIGSLNDFSVIQNSYYNFINFSNKLITISFIGIFVCFLDYILLISYPNLKQNVKKLNFYSFGTIFLIFIILLFTNIKLVSYANVTNVTGSTATVGYIVIAILLATSFIISLRHVRTIDKRYFAIFIITPLMIVGSFVTLVVPNIIIYDVIVTMFCYIMFFTMENPDIKMLDEIHKSKEISDNANEEKAIFLYNMTQEIREIVSDINNDANNILDSNSIEENKNYARNIIATTSKFSTMANGILDISTVENDTVKVYNNKYSIKTILKQLVSVYNDRCKNKGLHFISNIDRNIPDEMYGDSIGLKEILNIILENAYKYTDKGYVEFDVNTITKNDICRLIITIEDSGTGIKSEDINNLKVSNTSLAKANNLIIKMNGTMLISSDFGVGTKIKVVLDQRIEINNNSEIAKYDNIFDNIKILCVDNSEAGLKIVDKLLNSTNIKISKANNGKEFLENVRANKYDLVLLDESLDEVSGFDLMKKIKEVRNFNTPVILLTKDNSYEYNEEYLKVGFSDYLLKPIKKNELLDKINKYAKK